ncbi:class I SAM-dependent methyltransferase [Chitinophaga nivalis]|uniref:Class I SAM-dependent methyltransferase n=1 Tax=Chitinophaga nivalis TaxID=2991709 RepID=A0ABT3IKH8_9BACT|nr:class I SAM-dependent methyltransferase [Chitinophaga nivalis]MCW3465851.1 class I SAM-dependent methyltransferase [Chitinophaga nivalis]MCW3484458.1 class I SAM-dependent methyltransferase [Chitinophaga nivalis]
MTNQPTFNFLTHNQSAWDKQALAQHEWSRPVSSELTTAARNGQWEVHLTPQPLDKSWLGNIKGKRILCLASAGGQQGPILAAAGAEVTVYDLSIEQLNQDKMVAERDGLTLQTVQGDMTNLQAFAPDTFDLIFHPISNLYVPDVNGVWQACYRVLKPGGALLSSFYNPVVFIGDRNPEYKDQGIIKPRYKVPYADVKDLEPADIERKVNAGEALVFGHSLTDLIGGQTKAGFVLTGFYEDFQPRPRFLVDHYLPTFLATRAVKL